MVNYLAKLLMEVDDSGTLEKYDYNIVENIYAECNKCGKIEIPEDEEDGAETGIYYCNDCKNKS